MNWKQKLPWSVLFRILIVAWMGAILWVFADLRKHIIEAQADISELNDVVTGSYKFRPTLLDESMKSRMGEIKESVVEIQSSVEEIQTSVLDITGGNGGLIEKHRLKFEMKADMLLYLAEEERQKAALGLDDSGKEIKDEKKRQIMRATQLKRAQQLEDEAKALREDIKAARKAGE